jgi:hypothetical protein
MNNKYTSQNNRYKTITSFIVLFFISVVSFAQDTIRVKKVRHYYDDCYLVLCADSNCYKDTIPKSIFKSEAKIEVRMYKDCEAGKTKDIFVSSFQLEFVSDSVNIRMGSASSFFNDKQKQVIANETNLKSIKLSSIQLHAPDGFKKMPDLEIMLK